MFVLFDDQNRCYGIYDKIEYVSNIIDIVHTLNSEIVLHCRKYHLNTNNFDVIQMKSNIKKSENPSTKAYESQLPRIENWYTKFESDLQLYNEFKLNEDKIPLLFEDKFALFSKIDELTKLEKFSMFIEKFYLKDNNDTSLYNLF